MAISFAAATKNARADNLTSTIGNAALLRIYNGTPPANADTALSGNTLLAELTCSSPFAPAASGGVLTASGITQDSSANATGTASFFRIYKSDGTTSVMQGTCTATGGGGDLQLNTTSIAATQPVQVSSFVLTEGG